MRTWPRHCVENAFHARQCSRHFQRARICRKRAAVLKISLLVGMGRMVRGVPFCLCHAATFRRHQKKIIRRSLRYFCAVAPLCPNCAGARRRYAAHGHDDASGRLDSCAAEIAAIFTDTKHSSRRCSGVLNRSFIEYRGTEFPVALHNSRTGSATGKALRRGRRRAPALAPQLADPIDRPK